MVGCRGSHTIHRWCKLQVRVALPSCEAELNSCLKGPVEGLNLQGVAKFVGDKLALEIRTDASAARGVLLRQGAGKVRHLQVKQLWLQELVANEEVVITNVQRTINCIYALTHPWVIADDRFLNTMSIEFRPISPIAELVQHTHNPHTSPLTRPDVLALPTLTLPGVRCN